MSALNGVTLIITLLTTNLLSPLPLQVASSLNPNPESAPFPRRQSFRDVPLRRREKEARSKSWAGRFHLRASGLGLRGLAGLAIILLC